MGGWGKGGKGLMGRGMGKGRKGGRREGGRKRPGGAQKVRGGEARLEMIEKVQGPDGSELHLLRPAPRIPPAPASGSRPPYISIPPFTAATLPSHTHTSLYHCFRALCT